MAGRDFGRFDIDRPPPTAETASDQGAPATFAASASAGSTLRQILQANSIARGRNVIGTGGPGADRKKETAEATGADGFVLAGRVHAAYTRRALDPLVPMLGGGLLRSEYGPTLLRGNPADC